jgi:4-amino-4-deoxy-L-arabinose transferase-like glycosyltransferase
MLALEHLVVANNPTRAAAAAFWAGTALAVLTKGPVAPLFIVSTLIGIWALRRRWEIGEGLIATILLIAGALVLGPILLLVPAAAASISFLQKPKEWHHLRNFHLQWGLLLFLVITLPWFVAAWHATSGEFFQVAIGCHVVQRGMTALEGHGAFPGFYPVTGLILCFPWLAAALGAGIDTWRERRNAPEKLFLMAWALGPLVALELIQTKLVHYWLPSYPALILLAVGWLWVRPPLRVHGVLVALQIAGGCLLAAIPLVPAFYFDLTNLQKPAVMLSGLLAATIVLSSLKLRSRPIVALTISTAGTLAFLTLLFGPFLSEFSLSFLGARTADAAGNHLKRGTEVALYGLRNEEMLFSLPPKTRVFRTPSELPVAEDLLFVTREKDLVRDLSGNAGLHPDVVERIEGLDLGHGQTAATVFFRLREEP